ncbi:MAG: DinB family protein, partial [Anaerolineae bacterium]|nr:DinB family protein [Anaerolineae bacterium]
MIASYPTKQGRPREYGFQALPGFADQGVALVAAALDELRARVIDQIEDLPPEALRFVPPGTTLTIGALAAHLVWAEAGWIERIARGTGQTVTAPPDLRAAVDPAGRALPRGEQVIPDLDAPALVAFC